MADGPILGAVLADTSSASLPDTSPLIGRHVKLEPLTEAHMSPLWSTVGRHTELWAHWPGGVYKDEEHFTTELRGLLKMTNLYVYTAFVHGDPVGVFMIQSTDTESRVAEVGMVYGPLLQRTLAATEGFYMIACSVFDKLHNRRMEWKTDSLNVASRRAAERYGLSFEGCLRQHKIQFGRNRDTVWYSMIDGEWPLCKRAFEAWLDDGNFGGDGKQKEGLADIRKRLASEGA